MSSISGLVTKRDATFSACRVYRYWLYREWTGGAGRVAFVLLNPSTADETKDDPTIRRCIGFARAWGYHALDILNLFALRSTHPALLYRHESPVGPDNDEFIKTTTYAAAAIVCAWGVHGILRLRGDDVTNMLATKPLKCLGRTSLGMPRHPLYLPSNAKLEDWRRP